MPIFHRMEQGSAEWWKIRLGIPTASNADMIVTPAKCEPSASRSDYMDRLIAERLLKDVIDTPLNGVSWIERGKEREPHAAARFIETTGLMIEPIGFVTDNHGRMGASPDRLVVGKREAVEIKCPLAHTMIRYLRRGPGKDYRPQVQWQMMVGEFECIHFFAEHPRMPPKHLIILRDDAYIDKMYDHALEFCEELDAETEKAKKLGDYLESDWFKDGKIPPEWIIYQATQQDLRGR